MTNENLPDKNLEETTNYMRVGRSVACGHCQPEKYAEGLAQAEKMGEYKCDCKCHDTPANDAWEKEDAMLGEVLGLWNENEFVKSRDLFRAQIRAAQERGFKKYEEMTITIAHGKNHPRKMKQREGDIQAAILDYLTKRQVFHYKQSTTGIYKQATGSYIPSPSKGAPDIVCIIQGRYVGLECKTAKGKLSDDQAEFHRQILKAGGIVFVVRSIDQAIEAVEDTMARLKRTPQLKAA